MGFIQTRDDTAALITFTGDIAVVYSELLQTRIFKEQKKKDVPSNAWERKATAHYDSTSERSSLFIRFALIINSKFCILQSESTAAARR